MSDINLDMFIQLTIIGLAMGTIYALMSMGLVLLIRSIGVLNFAQGDLFMVGAFITWGLTYQMHLPIWGVWIGMLIIFAVFAAMFMFTVYWPLRTSSWPQAIIICTIGASFVISEGVTLIWTPIPRPMAPIIPGNFSIGETTLAIQYIVTLGVAVVLIASVFLLFDKLYAGRVMEAAAQNKYVAEILGIPTILTTLATYIIVMIIAGTGGYLVAPIFFRSVRLSTFQLRAFAGVIIGGFGNLKGAVVGSIIIGLVESYGIVVTTTYSDALVFLVLLIMLIVRPQGIFGEKISDKA